MGGCVVQASALKRAGPSARSSSPQAGQAGAGQIGKPDRAARLKPAALAHSVRHWGEPG
jgi:hypothetical protein